MFLTRSRIDLLLAGVSTLFCPTNGAGAGAEVDVGLDAGVEGGVVGAGVGAGVGVEVVVAGTATPRATSESVRIEVAKKSKGCIIYKYRSNLTFNCFRWPPNHLRRIHLVLWFHVIFCFHLLLQKVVF